MLWAANANKYTAYACAAYKTMGNYLDISHAPFFSGVNSMYRIQWSVTTQTF